MPGAQTLPGRRSQGGHLWREHYPSMWTEIRAVVATGVLVYVTFVVDAYRGVIEGRDLPRAHRDPAAAPRRRGRRLLRNLSDVELITADYVASYNQQRLMRRLGPVPPA